MNSIAPAGIFNKQNKKFVSKLNFNTYESDT